MYLFTILSFDVLIRFITLLFIHAFIYGLQTNVMIPILNCALQLKGSLIRRMMKHKMLHWFPDKSCIVRSMTEDVKAWGMCWQAKQTPYYRDGQIRCCYFRLKAGRYVATYGQSFSLPAF